MSRLQITDEVMKSMIIETSRKLSLSQPWVKFSAILCGALLLSRHRDFRAVSRELICKRALMIMPIMTLSSLFMLSTIASAQVLFPSDTGKTVYFSTCDAQPLDETDALECSAYWISCASEPGKWQITIWDNVDLSIGDNTDLESFENVDSDSFDIDARRIILDLMNEGAMSEGFLARIASQPSGFIQETNFTNIIIFPSSGDYLGTVTLSNASAKALQSIAGLSTENELVLQVGSSEIALGSGSDSRNTIGEFAQNCGVGSGD